MFKLLFKLIFYSIVLAIAFVIITFWGEGGDKFRVIGEKTGGFISKYTDELAKMADDFYDLISDKKKRLGKGRKLVDE
ncbi:MAG TPA: hypothetical protein HPP56_01185 [Nitrospirae bacterium]|nr:hypothetical protein [Nitrospirota bacterium]